MNATKILHNFTNSRKVDDSDKDLCKEGRFFEMSVFFSLPLTPDKV